MHQLSGINTVSMYAPVIFDKQPNSATLSSIMAAIQVIFAAITPLLVDRFGRRTIFLWGAGICTVGHLMSFIGYTENEGNTTKDWVLNVGILLFGGAFNCTYGVATWLYVAEILPVVWMGYSGASSWVFGILVAVASPYCIDGIGKWTFFILMMFTLGSGPFFWFCTSETKDKSINEIRRDYETKGSNISLGTETGLAKRTESELDTHRCVNEVI